TRPTMPGRSPVSPGRSPTARRRSPRSWRRSMARRGRLCVLILLPCALLPTAGASSFQPDKPRTDATLLQPCQDPLLAPVESSDNELAAERLRVAKAYL